VGGSDLKRNVDKGKRDRASGISRGLGGESSQKDGAALESGTIYNKRCCAKAGHTDHDRKARQKGDGTGESTKKSCRSITTREKKGERPCYVAGGRASGNKHR